MDFDGIFDRIDERERTLENQFKRQLVTEKQALAELRVGLRGLVEVLTRRKLPQVDVWSKHGERQWLRPNIGLFSGSSNLVERAHFKVRGHGAWAIGGPVRMWELSNGFYTIYLSPDGNIHRWHDIGPSRFKGYPSLTCICPKLLLAQNSATPVCGKDDNLFLGMHDDGGGALLHLIPRNNHDGYSSPIPIDSFIERALARLRSQ